MGTQSYQIEIQTEGNWEYMHIRGSELDTMQEVAKAIWGKTPENRPTVRIVLNGTSIPVLVCKGGQFRKIWNGQWVRIIRDSAGNRTR